MFFASPSDRSLNAGEELFLRYGGHSNRTLFGEYGFVDKHADPCTIEIDVRDLVNDLIDRLGEAGKECREILERHGQTL